MWIRDSAILYELHIRDLSLDPRSGITNKGKFLGLTERGTVTPQGDVTGIDHLWKWASPTFTCYRVTLS